MQWDIHCGAIRIKMYHAWSEAETLYLIQLIHHTSRAVANKILTGEAFTVNF
jgi:hypothetical protein